MGIRNYNITVLVCIGILLSIIDCTSKKEAKDTSFTRTDSLTERYLTLQDSLLYTWNLMIKDDNQKIAAMGSLLHELSIGGQFDQAELNSLEQRITQLNRIRYTPKTMNNVDIVEEYDFASNSLVSELIILAESHSAFSYNTVMQDLVEEIRGAELRVENYRIDYDAVALNYNHFLEENRNVLIEINDRESPVKKVLFQMTSE